MDCAEFRNRIQELAREEISGDSALTEALLHAEYCPACDALLREAERLTADLHSVGAHLKFEAAPARVEAALLDAFRQQHSPVVRVRKAGAWLAVPAAGLAAAALLLFFVTRDPAGRSPAQPSAPQAAPRQSAPSPSPREIWADYALEGETPEEAASAFIPLATTFDPSWIEGGAIVRVVLSRSALESFGVPVVAGGNNEMVADVVVSFDGTPEAIRVVDWQAADIQ
jgi:hypothetical protein